MSIFLLWNNIILKDALCSTQLYRSVTLKLDHRQTFNATLLDKNYVNSLQECSVECLVQPGCLGVLFQKKSPEQIKCKTAHPGVNIINMINLNVYKAYMMLYAGCLGVVTPLGWTAGCPTLYLSLDDDHGGQIIGPAPESLQFTPG